MENIALEAVITSCNDLMIDDYEVGMEGFISDVKEKGLLQAIKEFFKKLYQKIRDFFMKNRTDVMMKESADVITELVKTSTENAGRVVSGFSLVFNINKPNPEKFDALFLSAKLSLRDNSNKALNTIKGIKKDRTGITVPSGNVQKDVEYIVKEFEDRMTKFFDSRTTEEDKAKSDAIISKILEYCNQIVSNIMILVNKASFSVKNSDPKLEG